MLQLCFSAAVPSLTSQIDALLPQTQCQQCGFPRCFDYAEALAAGQSEINRCPPGGSYTRSELAKLLTVEPVELNPQCGTETPRQLFSIDESRCIGCTLCIQACPVDAIIGSGKKMHTILADDCTGCELCLPVCPVDCILVVPHPRADDTPSGKWPGFDDSEVIRARKNTNARLHRLAQQQAASKDPSSDSVSIDIKNEIAAAILRVKQKQRSRK